MGVEMGLGVPSPSSPPSGPPSSVEMAAFSVVVREDVVGVRVGMVVEGIIELVEIGLLALTI